MIILYRPTTNKVLWYQQGPWIYQHDVDILGNNEISIFSPNCCLAYKATRPIFNGAKRVIKV